MLEQYLKEKFDEEKIARKSIEFNKRASVAMILVGNGSNEPESLSELKVLFIRRPGQDERKRRIDRWAGHIAFPGGKREHDESDIQTAIRETKEEIGWNLQDSSLFTFLGRLDGREVKAPASSKTVMVLNAFVYLLRDASLPDFDLSAGEVYGIYLIPISYLISPSTMWEAVHFDISQHVAPNLAVHSFSRSLLTYMLGGINFFGIPALDEFLIMNANQSRKFVPKPAIIYPLWGLSLWMTSDLLLTMGATNFPIADKGAPQYTSWDVEMMMKTFHGFQSKKLDRYLLRSHLPIGLRTNFAIRFASIVAICLRIGFLYILLSKLLFHAAYLLSLLSKSFF